MSQNSRIHALPLHLANQIAAGEVIERPASVLKELIENSLDANAKQIHIEIEGAGSQLIKVRDDGVGIHPDDLSLALSRHATSKLHSSEQLSHIASLGFRGEALPSIASISQLTISSRQADSDHAWQLNGHDAKPTPAVHPIGSSVEVRELFFNVPARRHFLRGNKTELNHITTTLYRLALSEFETGFQCQLSNSSTISLPPALTNEQRQQRIAKLCGKTFLKQSIYIQQDFEDIKLHGWVANASGHRPQTDVQYFFINGRVIRDKVINHAIRQAYNEHIPAGRYPAFVLYLSLPLDRVDINVHPTKHEVRFRDARLIHGLISRAIEDALATHIEPDLIYKEQQQQISALHSYATDTDIASPVIKEQVALYTKQPTRFVAQTSENSVGMITELVSQRYALLRTESYPLLIDLQIAQQQLHQRQFQHAITENNLKSRPILVPIKVSLQAQQIASLELHNKHLTQLGFQLVIHELDVNIRAIPSLFSQIDIIELINNIATNITDQTSSQKLIDLLERQLPLIPVQTFQQAAEILKQLDFEEDNQHWSRLLDDETLKRLF